MPSACTVTTGFPIRRSQDQSLLDSSPGLIAAYRVLHRLITPRHPPCTLSSLITSVEGPRGPQRSAKPPKSASNYLGSCFCEPCGNRQLLRTQTAGAAANDSPSLCTFQRAVSRPRRPDRPVGRGCLQPLKRRIAILPQCRIACKHFFEIPEDNFSGLSKVPFSWGFSRFCIARTPGGPPGQRPLAAFPGFFPSPFRAGSSGDERVRTADLLVANQSLSQLSYVPLWRASLPGDRPAAFAASPPARRCFRIAAAASGPRSLSRAGGRRLGLVGVEPTTSPLSGVRSSQLSYKPSTLPAHPLRPGRRGRSAGRVPRVQARCLFLRREPPISGGRRRRLFCFSIIPPGPRGPGERAKRMRSGAKKSHPAGDGLERNRAELSPYIEDHLPAALPACVTIRVAPKSLPQTRRVDGFTHASSHA